MIGRGEQIVATDAANVGKIRAGGKARSARKSRAASLGRAAELRRSPACTGSDVLVSCPNLSSAQAEKDSRARLIVRRA